MVRPGQSHLDCLIPFPHCVLLDCHIKCACGGSLVGKNHDLRGSRQLKVHALGRRGIGIVNHLEGDRNVGAGRRAHGNLVDDRSIRLRAVLDYLNADRRRVVTVDDYLSRPGAVLLERHKSAAVSASQRDIDVLIHLDQLIIMHVNIDRC